MMQFGSKAPWKTVLKLILPEEPNLSAKSILEYYKPLQDWLEKANNVTDNYYDGLGSTNKSESYYILLHIYQHLH